MKQEKEIFFIFLSIHTLLYSELINHAQSSVEGVTPIITPGPFPVLNSLYLDGVGSGLVYFFFSLLAETEITRFELSDIKNSFGFLVSWFTFVFIVRSA